MTALNNGRAALNEKAPSDHHNGKDNVNASTKVLAMRKRIQVLPTSASDYVSLRPEIYTMNFANVLIIFCNVANFGLFRTGYRSNLFNFPQNIWLRRLKHRPSYVSYLIGIPTLM